jgi:phospholipase C
MLASVPVVGSLLGTLGTVGGDEEAPQDMFYGEVWAHRVIEAVLRSPAWPRTLLIYTYDEHGGYYDHVPPPSAIPPDRSRRSSAPAMCPGVTTSTGRGCPPSSPRRTPSRAR